MGEYTLEWRPVNPDGKPVGDWIRDPKFRFKSTGKAWSEFAKLRNESLYSEARLLRDGKELIKFKKLGKVM